MFLKKDSRGRTFSLKNFNQKSRTWGKLSELLVLQNCTYYAMYGEFLRQSFSRVECQTADNCSYNYWFKAVHNFTSWRKLFFHLQCWLKLSVCLGATNTDFIKDAIDLRLFSSWKLKVLVRLYYSKGQTRYLKSV